MDGDHLVGRYVHSDPHKPYLHPLRTPTGHTVSLFSPHDHKHHKGLMYALWTRGVNFWEEYVVNEGDKVGRQRHEAFDEIVDSADVVGFRERLTWLAHDGTLPTFAEIRSVRCRSVPDQSGYEWTWSTELEAQRDLDLVMSGFSIENAHGQKVNYHGLGLRLRRDFGCTGGNRLVLDGVEVPFGTGMGASPKIVAFEGSIDSTMPTQGAGVRLEQEKRNALFALDAPFAFLSLGPSNLEVVSMAAGDVLDETYTVVAYDCEPPPRRRRSP